ncbi:hypothetical protein Pstr01_37750 [Pseudomonas straminea]|uniref:Uncharacterized protein n=1 Tax=Pseudomonas straminea TaxID=47882 RepID=A0A1I1XW09_PSEOC|nr:hypothetical protein [Pseudomonas straminea]GLX15536.1 hypothetical protein Pstr01_37750 [Pseudomonas straminea]SFE11339.1 hypothetical protein SAMN05216372_1093 [Pseudomonas straminea]
MRLLLLTPLLCLAGCAITNYQEVAPGEYRLTAHGNIFQSKETLLKSIEKKASKLCGERGYALAGEGALSTEPVVSYYNGQQINASAVLLTETARCGNAAKQAPAPAAADAP